MSTTTTEAPAIRERGILFTAENVRGILEGRKVQTRRIVKGAWHEPDGYLQSEPEGDEDGEWWFSCRNVPASFVARPPYPVGSRAWVRETWADTSREDKRHPYSYRADWSAEDDANRDFKWRPAIFMPRRASRITLEITGVRVERLQDITEEDAKAEGALPLVHLKTLSHRKGFRLLWSRIHGPGSWERNEWVFVIAFRRLAP